MTLMAHEVGLRLATSSSEDQSCIRVVRTVICKSIIEIRQTILVFQSHISGNGAPRHPWLPALLRGPFRAFPLHQSKDLLSYSIVLNAMLLVLLCHVLQCFDMSEFYVLFSLPSSEERNHLVLAVQGCLWAACIRNTQMWW